MHECYSAAAARIALVVAALVVAQPGVAAPVSAGDCSVRASGAGPCQWLLAGAGTPSAVMDSGVYSGNFDHVVIRPRATVTLSGNIEHLTVRRRARLYLSGNAGQVDVWGAAEITGNVRLLVVHEGGSAIIRGVASEVAGPGHIAAMRGSVVNGVPVP